MSFPGPSNPNEPGQPGIPGLVHPGLEGARLFERYQVIRQLGRGGMGVVYLVRDEELEIDIALKLIPDLLLQDQVALDELKHEVLRGMALTHPGIVRTHGFVRDVNLAAIAMEFVDGGNFHELKLSLADHSLDAEELLPWLEQLGPVLDYAHFEIRIAHRDLKPHNLMWTQAGRIKVADFGISSTLNDTISRVSLRTPSSGTPAYMSPQQIMGEKPSHLDDIYALGATLYDLLTGKPPFHHGHVLAQVLESTPVPIHVRRAEFGIVGKDPIPSHWEETIAACLAKNPSDRPRSAGEVVSRLRGLETIHLPSRPSTTPQSPTSPARRPRRQTSSATKWATAGVLVALLSAGFAIVGNRDKTNIADIPPSPPPPVDSGPKAPPAAEPLRITTPDELPTATAEAPYSQSLSAIGGNLPYDWSSSEPLPEGLLLDPNGTISGIPNSASDSMIHFKATDSGGLQDVKPVRLVIREKFVPPPIPIPIPIPIPEPVQEPAVVEPVEVEMPTIAATQEHPHENSLGMRFVPSGAEHVLFSIWLTRVVDFRTFVDETGYDAKKDVHSVDIGGIPGFFVRGETWENPGFAQTDQHPVCGISWDDANAFCVWLTKHEKTRGTLPDGFVYRLPTDAEWKSTLPVVFNNPNAGKIARFPWGTFWPPPAGTNFAGEEMRDGGFTPRHWPIMAKRDNFNRTSPVGETPANRFGIHDYCGNLWQFCLDELDPGNQVHILRGGSWGTWDRDELNIDKPSKKRGAGFRVVDAGFRCVIARTEEASP